MSAGGPLIVAGVGCRRGAEASEIAASIRAALERAALAPGALRLVATAQAKGGEAGIAAAAAQMGVPLVLVAQDDLVEAGERTVTRSKRVQAAAGVPSVAEAAALAAAGPAARLLTPRVVVGGAACALARPAGAPAGAAVAEPPRQPEPPPVDLRDPRPPRGPSLSAATAGEAAVVGAGPAGLMAAEVLARAGVPVTVYDAMPSAGRKLLMAGRGGLNLTHSEALAPFLARYRGADAKLLAAIERFPPASLRAWSAALGQDTFVGSSGRVFPHAFKASPLLRAWLARLTGDGVRLALRHRFEGFDEAGRLRFTTADGARTVAARATVLALGGASWPRLGSDGAWTAVLKTLGVALAPLLPANCAFAVPWSDVFKERFAGAPLKGIALTFGPVTVRGEAVVTRAGIEGTAVYALSAPLRDAVLADGAATLSVALRPDMSAHELAARLGAPRRGQSLANVLRKAVRLSPVAIGLLREAEARAGPALSALGPQALARAINAVPLTLTGTAPLARAISTAGGIALKELDGDFMIRRLPGVFAAGEMLDFEAPTGGYLLQAAFATGAAAGRGALRWLAVPAPPDPPAGPDRDRPDQEERRTS